jgi:polar amino acid transport system substrate-binding protein
MYKTLVSKTLVSKTLVSKTLMSKALAALILAAGTCAALAQSAGNPAAKGSVVTPVQPDVLKELAPTGKLRAALNLGNGVLVQGPPEDPRGVTVDLSRELAKRIGVPVQFVTYPAAGKVFEALKTGAWDVAFFAIEPVRAAEVEFTAPYVLIEGTYMVLKDSPLKVVADVDRPGVRIAVGVGSAYDLFLTRNLKNATIVRASTGGGRAMIDLFLSDKLEAAAGVKQPLVEYAKTDPRVRVMDGRFQVIEQAMGTPRGRTAAANYLRAFVEEMKASGFVADALKRSNQPDAEVAPPAG